MVDKTKVQNGIAMYLDKELMPHLNKSTLSGFVTGAAAALVIKRMDMVFEHFKDNGIIRALGVFDKEGNIDVDVLRDVMLMNMPEEGLKVDLSNLPILNLMKSEQYKMTFHKEDIDTLYKFIMEG